LGLCGIAPPSTVEGTDFSKALLDGKMPEADAALIACYAPFGEWTRTQGGREYRGVRTRRYTYVRGIEGPWLLYDNENDPYQMKNLCGDAAHAKTQARLDTILNEKLAQTHDAFRPASEYIAQWHYTTDANGTVPYTP